MACEYIKVTDKFGRIRLEDFTQDATINVLPGDVIFIDELTANVNVELINDSTGLKLLFPDGTMLILNNIVTLIGDNIQGGESESLFDTLLTQLKFQDVGRDEKTFVAISDIYEELLDAAAAGPAKEVVQDSETTTFGDITTDHDRREFRNEIADERSSFTTVTTQGLETDGTIIEDTATETTTPTNTTIITDTTTSEDNSKIIGNTNDIDGTIDSSTLTATHGTITVAENGNIIYTPDENYNGTDTITISILSADGTTTTQIINLNIDDVNDAPTLDVQSTATVAEDGSTTITFTPADVDGTIVSTTASVPEDQGTAIVNNDGTITFVPIANYNGEVTMTVVTTDDDGATTTQTSLITVTPENDVPTIEPISTQTVEEDGSKIISFTATDIDNDTLTPSVSATNGTATINENGDIVFIPTPDFNGTATVTVNVDDGHGGIATQTFDVTVSDVNDGPTITTVDGTTTEDGASVTVAYTAADVDGTIVSTTASVPADQGTVTIDEVAGTVTFTPAANFHGEADITITTTDDDGAEATTTSTITVSDVNDGPTITTVDGTTTEDGASVTVAYTAADVDGTIVSTTASVPADQGTVTIDEVAGTVTFTPAANFHGEADITITTTDDDGAEATTTSTITVSDVNDNPDATAETASVNEDAIVTGQIDATDVDSDSLTFAVSSGTDIPEGLVVNADGSYTFDASSYDSLDAGSNNIIEVPITVTDEDGGSVETTLTIDIAGVNNDLTYTSESASYSNVVGYYEIDSDGNPVSPATVVIDDQNGMTGGTHLDDLNPNAEYGFFIIANGASQVEGSSVITFDTSGDIPTLLIDGSAVSDSYPVYHDTPTFNTDGADHFILESDGSGGTTIKIEDLPDLGDNDFNDVVLNVNFEIADKIIENEAPDAVDDTLTSVDVTTTTTVFSSSFEGTDSFEDSYDGWSSASGEKIEVWNESATSYEAADGDGFVELNTDDSNTFDDASSISRTVNTVDGATYDLDFQFSPRPGYDADVCQFEVIVDGEVLGTYSVDGTGNTSLEWTGDAVSFTGTGESVVIEFRETGDANPGAGRGMYLDDINLTQTVTTTQEQSLTTDEDSAITVDVLGNDTDPESDSLSISEVQGQDVSSGQTVNVTNDSGTVIGTAAVVDGKIVFTPGDELDSLNAGENQDVSFAYTISDGEGGSDSANVTINVTGLSNDDTDTTASAPTLEISIGDAVITSTTSNVINVGDDYEDGTTELKGSGSDDIIVASDNWDKIDGKDGNDTLVLEGSASDYTITQGSGSGSGGKEYYEKDGHTIEVKNVETVEFSDTSSNNDNDTGTSTTKLKGDSDDDIIIAGDDWDKIDGKGGNDTLVLEGSESDYTITEGSGSTDYYEKDGHTIEVKNIETVEFTETSTLDETASSYEYPVTLTATLTDTDGSETLSSITVDNLPTGVTVQAGSGITDNGNGTYSVSVTSGTAATITLLSSAVVSASDLNGITASVTSTETSSGETTTVTTCDDLTVTGITLSDSGNLDTGESMIGTSGDDIFDVDNDIQGTATVDAGAGNDTLSVADDIEDDAQIDMGSGDDTIHLEDTVNDAEIRDDAQIDFGEGMDTLIIEDDIDMNFDNLLLDGSADNQINNLEVIDMQNDSGHNDLENLDISDVLNMTDDDNILKILGDSGDEIGLTDDNTADDNWIKSDDKVTEGDETFDVWTNNDATVYIDEDITVTDI